MSSCDSPTRPQEKPEKQILPLPANGTSPLPAGGLGKLQTSAPGNESTSRPAYGMLQDYAKSHPGHPWVAAIGKWNAEKGRYEYRSMRLDFPDSLIARSGTAVNYFQYRMLGTDGKSYRVLAGLIPTGPEAWNMMKRWLQVRDRSRVVARRVVSSSNASETVARPAPVPFVNDPDNEGETHDDCPNGIDAGCHLEETVVTAPAPDDDGGGLQEPDQHQDWPVPPGQPEGESGCPAGCGGGDDGSGASSGFLITFNPTVKYPPYGNYAQKYPKFTEYLKNKLPTLKNNDTIINAIEEYTSLTSEDIASDLQWGKGPTIKIVQLDIYANCDKGCLGAYSEVDPDVLYIDVDLVNDLESQISGTSLGNAFAFLVGVSILHEYVHYGDNLDGNDYPGEEGELFEKDVYGQTVWRSNADDILLKK